MKSQRQKVLEDCLTIYRRNTNDEENSEPIPIDLIIEILLKLPAKSIAKCRCVSKLWASILRRPDFTEFFLTRSLARPQLLFAFQILSELFFFSTPQPQPQPQNPDCPVVASYHMKVPCFPFEDISLMRGLVCLNEERILKGRKNPVLVWIIFNPSTGQSLTLPKMKTTKRVGLMSYFGYDPIGQQYKVLSTITSPCGRDDGNRQYQILTLGTGEFSWRMIDPCRPHVISYGNKICINGVLYYRAGIGRKSSKATMLVRFDFSSEKLFFIEIMESFSRALHTAATLINYNGKLGSLLSEGPRFVTGETRSFELWVLEDVEKHEWSKHTYILPPLWKHMVGDIRLNFVGVTRTNEIMLSPDRLDTPFVYVFYYNMESQTISITRVQIQGMEKLQGIIRVNTFLDHVENVKLLQSF